MKDKFETLSEALKHVLEMTKDEQHLIHIFDEYVTVNIFRECKECCQTETTLAYTFFFEGGRKL